VLSPVLDSDGRPQFLHLLIIDMRLAHKVSEGIGNRVQLALNRLVAPPLGVLKHCNQHHDDDRHDRRAGSQPSVREPSDDPQRKPGQDTGNTSNKERPPIHGMHGYRSHFVESPSVTVDLAWRECPRPAPLLLSAPRAFVVETLRAWDITAAKIEAARLVVSELVTNAVVHAPESPSITAGILMHEGAIRLLVSDRGLRQPERRDRLEWPAESGQGIWVIEALGVPWGSDVHERGGKTVWCDLSLEPPTRHD
jgi:Histidine kinase-like ATPase domain